jgi:hypothetical protein
VGATQCRVNPSFKLSKSNWKNYAGAGALIGATAGLTGGATLLNRSALQATAGYTGNTTKQYISTGKVNQRQAVISGVVNAIGGRNNKSTNNLKINAGGGGSKPSDKASPSSSSKVANSNVVDKYSVLKK